MVVIYPVVLSAISEGFMAYVPDCEINTWGADLAAAMAMARDAISLWCVSEQDDGNKLPSASLLSAVKHNRDDIVTLIDANLDAYRISKSLGAGA